MELRYSPDRFGLCSLRAGGAMVATNKEVQDRLFKSHWRWRSKGAKDDYVEDSTEKHLLILQQLSLYPFECLSGCGAYLCMWLSICFVRASIAGMENGRRLAFFVTLCGT